MLWTIAVILFILWLLGFVVLHVGGGLIHLLLVLAVFFQVTRVGRALRARVARRNRSGAPRSCSSRPPVSCFLSS